MQEKLIQRMMNISKEYDKIATSKEMLVAAKRGIRYVVNLIHNKLNDFYNNIPEKKALDSKMNEL